MLEIIPSNIWLNIRILYILKTVIAPTRTNVLKMVLGSTKDKLLHFLMKHLDSTSVFRF